MRLSRRTAAILGLLAAAALVAFALGWFPQAPLRSFLESRLRQSVGPGSRVGRVRVVPGRLSAEVHDLVLDTPSYRLEARRVDVGLSRRTLFGEGIFVDRLHMEGGLITLRAPAQPTPPAAPPEGPLVIRDIAVRDATVRYEDPALGGPVVLRGVELRGGLGQGELSAAAAGGVWQRPRPLPVGPLAARLRISPRLDIDVVSLEAGLERTRLRLAGPVGRVGALRLDLGFELRADLSELQALAAIGPASGVVAAKGRASGPTDALRIEAGVTGHALRVSGWPVEQITGDLAHASGEPGTSSATAELRLLGGRGRIEARLDGSRARGRFDLHGIDASRLQRQLGAAPLVAGTGSAAVRFEGDLARRLELEAEVSAGGRTAEGARFEAQGHAGGGVLMSGPEVDLDWDVAIDGSTAAGRAPGPMRLTAEGTARGAFPPLVSARIALAALGGEALGELSARGAALRRLVLRGRSLDLARLVEGASGRVEFDVDAAGALGALTGTARVTVDALGWRAVSLGPLHADVEARKGTAMTARVELPRMGAIARIGGPGRSRRTPTMTGTVTLEQTPLAPFAPLLGAGRPLEGVVSATADFATPLSAPARSTARVLVRRLEASSGPLAAHILEPFTLALESGRGTIAGLRIEGDGFTARADGSAGLAPRSPVDLRAAAAVHLPALAPEGWSVEGQARAEVTVTGTRAAPRVAGFATLDDTRLEGPALPPITVQEARLALTGDAVEVEAFRAAVAGGTVGLDGRVPLAAAYPKARRNPAAVAPQEEAGLTATWSGIETAALLERFRPGQDAMLDATLAGQATVRGGLASVSEPRVAVALPATAGRMQDLEVALAPAEIVMDEGRVRTGALRLSAGSAALDLSAEVDLPRRTVDASGGGTLELRTLSPFMEEAALTGTAEVDLRVRGALDAPRPSGTVRVRDATLRMRALPQAITGFGAEAVLDGETLVLRDATAMFGGGTLAAAGTARIEKAGLVDASFTLTGRDLAVRYPAGMRSRLGADLALTGRSGAFRLAGTVRALRGLYDLDTALQESLMAPEPEPIVSPMLRSIALDVRVLTESPVLVRNNMARLQADGRLAVRGDLETPAPVGTLEIGPGGKVFLQGREFVIGSGRLDYTGNWDPDLSLDATARIPDMDRQAGLKRADVEVTVSLAGQLMRPRLSLRSNPSYSEMEIASLIATGDSQNPSARLAVGGPAASLVAGRLSRSLSGLGLGEVSIQPELVAREGTVEPGARFTFGKRLAEGVKLVYSASLQDPENRFTELEGSPLRNVKVTARRTGEGGYVFGAGQRFHFGGSRDASAPRAERRIRVAAVRLEGDSPLEPGDLRDALRTSAGDHRSAWDIQDDADRLRRRLVDRGYLEAEVGARFDGQDAVFTVRSGERYRWTVRGMADPPDLSGTVRASLFAEEAMGRGQERLLEELRERGHLRAVVRATVEREEGGRRLAFSAEPGPVSAATVLFPGARALSDDRLLRAAGGAGALVTDPGPAVAGIEAAYRAAHFLTARAGPPRVMDEAGGARVRVVVPVREGPRARLSAVRFEGASLPEAVLREIAGLAPGSEYHPEDALAAADRLRGHYFGLGHPAVRVAPRAQPKESDLAVVFQVAEGERVTVGRVVLRGVHRAREGLVRGAIDMKPGDALDPREVADLERRLLGLGVFTRAAATVSEDNPATVSVVVEEGDRFRAGYLVSYDDDRTTRGELDGELRGLLGAGLALGARLSAGPDLRDVRGYLHVPGFLPTGRLTLSAFRLSEDLPLVAGEEDGETFERIQTGAQLQATRPLRDRWNLLYGYRVKKVTIDSPFLTTSRWVAGVDLSLLRDTRDNALDARRGRFLSLSLEVAPKTLGSDFNFVKGFAQAFFARPLAERWTWAHGYRVGMAHVFGGEPLVSDEGFEAGGANSIRGFEPGSVGPEGYRFGRQAALVVNQELRYHHPSGVGGALFYDAGNTFATVGEASLELRHVLGGGLRWTSPIGLLRLDVGFPLDRRQGEPAYKVFFSFGQAF